MRRNRPLLTSYIVVYQTRADGRELKWQTRVESAKFARMGFEHSAPPGAQIVEIYKESDGPAASRETNPVERRIREIQDKDVRIGYEYMVGKKSVKEVIDYVNSTNWKRGETEGKIARGAQMAEEEGTALKSRVQPKQDSNVVQASYAGRAGKYRTKLPPKSGKIAANPNYKSYQEMYKEKKKLAMAAKKPAPVVAPTGKRGRVLTKYDVSAINKQRDTIKEKDAVGSKRIRPTKQEIRSELHKKRQRFDIYNTSKHRYVKD